MKIEILKVDEDNFELNTWINYGTVKKCMGTGIYPLAFLDMMIEELQNFQNNLHEDECVCLACVRERKDNE